jgi:hypothetical protein
MASSSSPLWKYFLGHGLSTLYYRENVQYNMPDHYVPPPPGEDDDACDALTCTVCTDNCGLAYVDMVIFLCLALFVFFRVSRFV